MGRVFTSPGGPVHRGDRGSHWARVDTLRRYHAFDVGEMVWHEQIERPPELAARHGPLPPLPRVYVAAVDQEAPPFTWVNLPLAAMRRPREVVAVEYRVMAKLAEMRGQPFGWEAAT